MSLLKPKSLDEQICNLLIEGGLPASTVLSRLDIAGKQPTKQGFYASLRRLKADDIVVTYKGMIALNLTWVKQMYEAFERINAVYGGESPDILSLRDKESVSYNFSTLRQLDNYWGHIQDIVVRATPANEPVYTYDPHYWFYIARPEIEKAHITLTNSLGKQFLMTVEGSMSLDKVIKADFNDNMRQYHMERMFEKRGYYIVVVGDYIFEAQFSPDTEAHIEKCYSRHMTLTEEALGDFGQIPDITTRTKLKISRNKTRAQKIKTRLSKNFFIKPPVK